MRTFISRRNVNLVAFTLALAIDTFSGSPGYPISLATFYAIVAWQIASFLWHAQRIAKFWNDKRA